ncbi:MAG: efflux RND transporter permease subunit, partial [Symploca sp. SIO3E6]|nr:efflux RND transporter permease subunit [Caldora sp. SIO3E6]
MSLRERLNISRFAIAHSWLTICFWLALTVAGLFAFSSLKYALFPDITFPVVVVNAQAPLETALETEIQLTQTIEQQLQSLAGLDDTRSSTYSGQTVVSLAFDVGTNLESSTEAVKTALQQAELPPETTFEALSVNLNESAAISYAIKSEEKTLPELIQITQEQILPTIAELPGVLKVRLLGNATPDEAEPNSSITASPTLTRFNSENAVAFQVIKRGAANTLEVVSRVEAAVQQLQGDLPQVQLVLAETQADYIREATQATIDALLLAIVLAVLVIFPFLRDFRATLITALAIPISLLGTCIAMAVAGFNLETITLLALALVIGIIVDDAIVDVENISRHIEAGESPRQAAIAGTDEIGLTVSASTLTIVAVFLPIAFMGGTVGQFFKPFGLTVSVAVFTSLLVARTLSPVLAAYWLRRRDGEMGRWGDREIGRRGDGE